MKYRDTELTGEEERLILILKKLGNYLHIGNLFKYFPEIRGRSDVIKELEEAVKDETHFETKYFNSIFELRLFRIIIYILVRALKPETFLETGVLHGMTSHFILHALSKNEKGILVSIDYPSYYETGPTNQDGFNATLPPGRDPGWVIPSSYKDQWDLRIGRSVEQLPRILKGQFQADIFLHDSEHTYSTMWRELTQVWDWLRPGGILICDNINCNTSFFDFCLEKGIPPFVCSGTVEVDSPIRCGIIKKS